MTGGGRRRPCRRVEPDRDTRSGTGSGASVSRWQQAFWWQRTGLFNCIADKIHLYCWQNPTFWCQSVCHVILVAKSAGAWSEDERSPRCPKSGHFWPVSSHSYVCEEAHISLKLTNYSCCNSNPCNSLRNKCHPIKLKQSTPNCYVIMAMKLLFPRWRVVIAKLWLLRAILHAWVTRTVQDVFCHMLS